jgi:hypothetical protein
MPLDTGGGYGSGSTRPRIKGVGPKVPPIVDQIGRGYQPNRPEGRPRMEQDFAREAAGRRPSDADVNDDFARRLMGGADAQAGKAMSSAEARYRANLPKGYDPDQKYYHVHDVPEGVDIRQRAQSFRDKGIIGSERTSFGAGKQVFAHPQPPRELGPRQIYTEFTPGVRPSGSGTSFMGRGGGSTAKSFSGDISPANVGGVYGHVPGGGIGRIADAGSGITGLYGLLSSMFPENLPQIYGPTDYVLNDLLRMNYEEGVMNPYRDWAGDQPVSANGTVLA